MCGIAGIIYKHQSDALDTTIRRMTGVIVHRGPDGDGHWTDSEQRIALGHRRLAIIDLSENGKQPFLWKDRFVITFNGEIYNYIEVRDELKSLGYTFRSDSDTEVLVAAYNEWNDQCLSKLDGMFAFAIYDRQSGELFCARDRFGEKPFFYSDNSECFAFGSEMKVLHETGIPKKLNEKMLFQYLHHDVVENYHDKSNTFYGGIRQIPASHFLKRNRDGAIVVQRYWDLPISNENENVSFEDAQERFLELFKASVQRRLRSDVKTGSSLSGGVDSSSVLGMIKTIIPDLPFNTFTARFDDSNYDEGHFVEVLRQQHDFITHDCFPQPEQIIDELDTIFWHQEEPFGSTSIIAQWEVMRLAKSKSTTVLLDGQGADEAFAGYFRYFNPYLVELYKKDRKEFESELAAIEAHLGVSPYFSKKERIRLKSPGAYDWLAEKTRKLRSSTPEDLSPEFAKAYQKDPSPFHINPNLKEFLYNDLFGYGLGKLLRFSDRNAMAHSREVRLPYLSHELVEFMFTLPPQYFIHGGWTKRIIREAMRPMVPEEILFRKDKKGFQAPAKWLERDDVKKLIKSSTEFLREEGIVENPSSRKFWQYIMATKMIAATKN